MKENKNYFCCLCENNYNDDLYFYPLQCLKKHGIIGHCICNSCWWNTFSIEHHNHKCPGCIKNIPLNRVKHIIKNINNFNIIDLTN